MKFFIIFVGLSNLRIQYCQIIYFVKKLVIRIQYSQRLYIFVHKLIIMYKTFLLNIFLKQIKRDYNAPEFYIVSRENI